MLMPGGPWLRLFWGCLHSTAPAVPKGEPAPARQGRGARAEPREMPINSLRISVSPLCPRAPPEKGPGRCVRVSCCPTGLVAALWHRGRTWAKGAEVLGRAQKGAGNCGGRVLCVPIAVGSGAAGEWGGGTGHPAAPVLWALPAAALALGMSPELVHSRPLLFCPSGLAGKSR